MDDERLGDVRALHELKARYFRLMDTKQWSQWRELFTDDFVFYMEDSVLPATTEPVTVGGDAFVAEVSKVLSTAVSVHHGHMPEITFTGDRTATGIWAMFDWVDDAERQFAIQGFGHYHEKYVKDERDLWVMAELRLTRIRVDAVAPSRPAGERPWPPAWTAPG
jgi:hypothetical protein